MYEMVNPSMLRGFVNSVSLNFSMFKEVVFLRLLKTPKNIETTIPIMPIITVVLFQKLLDTFFTFFI